MNRKAAIPQKLLLEKAKDYDESIHNLFSQEEDFYKNVLTEQFDDSGETHIEVAEIEEDSNKINLIECSIKKFLTLQNQIEIYHWLTKRYSFHEALGETYDSLNELIDDFIELVISNRGRENIDLCNNITIQLNLEYQEECITKCIDCCIDCIKNDIYSELNEDEMEIKAVLDEILIVLSKLKYLLGMTEDE